MVGLRVLGWCRGLVGVYERHVVFRAVYVGVRKAVFTVCCVPRGVVRSSEGRFGGVLCAARCC